MNNYKLLGLQKNASIGEIRKAYIKLAKVYHPDTSTGDIEKFLSIKKAYDRLKVNSSEKIETDRYAEKRELNRARRLYKKHDYIKSSAVIRNYLLNNENDIEANFLYGILMKKFGKLHAAELSFKKVVSAQPYNTDALLNLAAIHKGIGLKSLAKQEIDRILSWDKSNKEALMMQREFARPKSPLKTIIKTIISGMG